MSTLISEELPLPRRLFLPRPRPTAESRETFTAGNLPTIISKLVVGKQTGRLTVSSAGFTGVLGLVDGQLLMARFGADGGLEAVDDMATGMLEGRFVFAPGETNVDRNVDGSREELQSRLESLQSWSWQLARRVPSLRGVPVRVSQAEPDGFSLDRDQLALLADVDGQQSVERLAATHGLAKCVRVLAELTDSGLIRFAAVPTGDRTVGSLVGAPPDRARARRWPGLPIWPDVLRWSGVRRLPVLRGWPGSRGSSTLRASPHRRGVVADRIVSPPAVRQTGTYRGPRWLTRALAVRLLVPGAMVAALLFLPTLVVIPPEVGPIAQPTQSATSSAPASAAAVTNPAQQTTASSPPVPVEQPIDPAAFPDTSRTVLVQSFTNTDPTWPAEARGTVFSSPDKYLLFSKNPGQFVGAGLPVTGFLRDVRISATLHKVSGPPGGGYGLIVRDQLPGMRDGLQQSGRFYVAEVSDRGEFGMWRRENTSWVDLIPWTASEAVHRGNATNNLVLRAVGNHLTLTVNDVEVGSHVDDTLTTGRVGAFVGGDENLVAVDRLEVQVAQ